MKIYLMRHGEASFDAAYDDVRELTERGRARIEWNVNQKHKELAGVDLFLSSPILRAKQTAELTRTLLQRNDPIPEVSWLIHETNPVQTVLHLSKLKVATVMLFSHQPLASRLVEHLCGLDAGMIALNTASIIAMEVDPVAAGFGVILWQLA